MPGPIGTWDQNKEDDDGTSRKLPSRLPGPVQERSPSLWARGEALYDAYERALLLAPGAVYQKTGYALGQLLKGLLPGLLQTLVILATSTAIGAAAGGVIGFFFAGAGAAPGVVLGGELGLEIGTAVLSWLGLAFLAKAILQGFGELWGILSMGVKRAWAAPESPQKEYSNQIEQAARDLADAVGILMLLILQAIVTWVFTRAAIGSTKGVIYTAGSNRPASTEAANEAVATLAQELRASRLGAGFAAWVEENWARLRDDPKLRFRIQSMQRGAIAESAAVDTAPAGPHVSASEGGPSITKTGDTFKATLRGEEVQLPNVETQRISYTKRAPSEKAVLRTAFDRKGRSEFLEYLGSNPERVAELQRAGFSDAQIADIAEGNVPDGWQVHHKVPLDDGGDNSFSNLVLIENDPYHKAITNVQRSLASGLAPGDTRVIDFPVPDGYVYPGTPR